MAILQQYYCDNGTATWAAWNSNATTTTSDIVWYSWQGTSTAATATVTATATAATIWYQWTCVDSVPAPPAPEQAALTVEEQSEQQAERERVRSEQATAYVARAAEVKEATERAVRLFEEQLSDEQLDQYKKNQSFTVVSRKSGRRYRIDHGIARNVRQLREDGSIEKTYCCHLAGDFPIHDHMVAQKLFLEHDEDTFLALANVS
jgi:hypothetical protein